MRGHDDRPTQQPTETLKVGPARAPLLAKVPARWRLDAVALVAFAVGLAAGIGGMLEWQDRQAPSPRGAEEGAVALLLVEALPHRTGTGDGTSAVRPLRVRGALLLSGATTSTVSGIGSLDPGVGVRAPALPVTMSAAARLQAITLEVVVVDCEAATRWTPHERPFTVTWRGEHGRVHRNRAGDFDIALALSFIRYVIAVCHERPDPSDGRPSSR